MDLDWVFVFVGFHVVGGYCWVDLRWAFCVVDCMLDVVGACGRLVLFDGFCSAGLRCGGLSFVD